MNRDDFLDKLQQIPHWVESFEDALKYAKHLEYRLLQTKESVKILDTFCEKYFSRAINYEIEKKITESNNLFDKWYNSMNNHKDDQEDAFSHFTP